MKYQKLSIKSNDIEPFMIDESLLVSPSADGQIMFGDDDFCVECRTGGIFKDRALFLPDEYDYVLGVDDVGVKILVILKKKRGRTL